MRLWHDCRSPIGMSCAPQHHRDFDGKRGDVLFRTPRTERKSLLAEQFPECETSTQARYVEIPAQSSTRKSCSGISAQAAAAVGVAAAAAVVVRSWADPDSSLASQDRHAAQQPWRARARSRRGRLAAWLAGAELRSRTSSGTRATSCGASGALWRCTTRQR